MDGSPVGLAEGDDEGRSVGEAVGCVVIVGDADGDTVGEVLVVGAYVGEEVGEVELGLSLGLIVLMLLGRGDIVGVPVGG